jgi:hypothetical protein
VIVIALFVVDPATRSVATMARGGGAQMVEQRQHIVPFDGVRRRMAENGGQGLAVMAVEIGRCHGRVFQSMR